METRCPYCNYSFDAPEEYSGKQIKCGKCKREFTLQAYSPVHNRIEEKYICTACGTITHDLTRKGSGLVELLLWLFIMWPFALAYSMWRRCFAPYYVCPRCKRTTLIPADSPVGRKITGL